MLRITIPSTEFWDEVKQEFVYTKAQTLQLEHSLVSLSKWESRWNKPFLTKQEKTLEETIDYVKCMTLTQNVNPEVYLNTFKSYNIPELYNTAETYDAHELQKAYFGKETENLRYKSIKK